MKNILGTNQEGDIKWLARPHAGSTRREVLQALWSVWLTAGGIGGLLAFLSSLPDDRNFQEAELEIVDISSQTQKWSLNPASRLDPAYYMNPARKLQFGNKEKYTISLQLPDGTIDSREVSEDIVKKLKKWDKILCKYLIRYDGMQLVTEVLPRTKKG